MLLRKDSEGVIAIGQPAHAWVAGQMARNWRLDDFVAVREEVCLAAEQHDLGFLAWEQAPTLNPNTGLPYTFLEMPRAMHLAIWTSGIQSMLQFGRYPAVLVSRHFVGLAQHAGRAGRQQEERLLIEFLDRQEAFQTSLSTSLMNDFYYSEFSVEKILRHHQRLVSLWDWISLLLCQGLDKPQKVVWNPWNAHCAELNFHPVHNEDLKVMVRPWPFAVPALKLICEGRRLLGTYSEEDAMRESLRAAAPVVLTITLERGA